MAYALVFATGLGEDIAQIVDAGGENPRRRSPFPTLHGEIFKGFAAFEVAKDEVELADYQLEHADLAGEEVDDVGLDGFVAAQVEDGHILVLAEAVQAADALLDAHGVPRQVVVDQLVAELEIAALGAAFGADHDTDFALR